MPVKTQSWRRLSEFVGQTIALTGEIRSYALPDGKSVKLARMADGEEVAIPDHVEFTEEGAQGHYRVREFRAKKYGTTGYSLVNAPE